MKTIRHRAARRLFPVPLVCAAAALGVILPISAANAALVTEAWQSPTDGLILYDSTTNLQWLNLTVSSGQSYNSVLAQLGTTYAGFSVASDAQVTHLFSDAGIIPNGGFSAGTNAGVNNLLALWGTTEPVSFDNQLYTFAITSTPSTSYPGEFDIAALGEQTNDPTAHHPQAGSLI